MSKFRKDGKKTTPMASTSSTSDIVFMFLFFFMVTTNLRKTENKVIVKLPGEEGPGLLYQHRYAGETSSGTVRNGLPDSVERFLQDH